MAFEKNGKIVNYVTRGDGPPVILIHGMAASLCDWSELIPELAGNGYSAYALDLLGHGDSAKPDDPQAYRVDSLFEHLAAWIESLDLEMPPVLVSHSLGGYLSLIYAHRHPDKIRGMVLIDPFYSSKQLSPLMRLARRRPALGEKAMRIVPEWIINAVMGFDPSTAAHFSPKARNQIVADYKRASPHFVYITRSVPDLTPTLPEIHTPARVIWGEKDLTLKPATFQRLAKTLPCATSHAIPNCGHQPHIGRPGVVNPLVLDFLEHYSVDAKPASR